MKLLHFGSRARQLFGAYHPPSESAQPRALAVLVCGPWLHERNMTHRALRNLAASLAESGFPALRFDYYGAGDSAGNTGDATPEEHAEDALLAGRELLEQSGAQALVVMGRELGAYAALRSAERAPVRHLMLWEPVERGSAFLRELEALDAAQRVARLVPRRARDPDTLLGFDFPARVRAAFAAFDAAACEPRVSGRVLMLAGARRSSHERLCRALSARGLTVDRELVPDDAKREPYAEVALLARAPVEAMVRWLAAQGDA